MIVVVVGGLGFSAILAWYLTQPIQRMQAGFGRLAQGNFATRLGPAMGRRRDEIADLAHDFDKMAVRLEELVAARDRLLADVSHELRTPLARLNLAIGLARQDPAKLATSLDRIGGEADKLDEMVGELLTLAKLESGQSRGEDYFNFAEIVKAVVQDARYEAAAKGVDVFLDIQPDDESFEWIALGSGKLVSRAIENIVRNAVRYSSEGGKVGAMLRRRGGLYDLRVTDEGPGVPEEAMSALFMPFGVSADGFGFGLGAGDRPACRGGTRWLDLRSQPSAPKGWKWWSPCPPRPSSRSEATKAGRGARLRATIPPAMLPLRMGRSRPERAASFVQVLSLFPFPSPCYDKKNSLSGGFHAPHFHPAACVRRQRAWHFASGLRPGSRGSGPPACQHHGA